MLWRDDQLRAVRTALQSAREQRPSVLVVEGGPGMGKTSLLGELRGLAADFESIFVEAHESEVPPAPFAVLRDWGVRSPGVDGSPAASLQSATGSLAARVDGLSRSAPVLLGLDDAQWADTESLVAVSELLVRAEGTRLLLAVARRPSTTGPSVAIDDLLDSSRTTRIRLDGMTPEQVATLVRENRPDVSPVVARDLWEHTEGNPLFVQSLLDGLTSAELDDLPQDLPAPRAFAQLVRRRLERVGEPTRGLMEALVVMGPGWTALPEVASVAEDHDPLVSVEELRAADLVELRSAAPLALRPVHALVRASVNQSLTLRRRQLLHARAAAVTHGASSLEHRLAATEEYDDVLAEGAFEHAERLYDTGHFRRAAHFYRAAHDVCSSFERREELQWEGVWSDNCAGVDSRTTRLAVDYAPGEDPACDVSVALALLLAGDVAGASRRVEAVSHATWRVASARVRGRWAVLAAYTRLLTGRASADVEVALAMCEPGTMQDRALRIFESPTRGFIAARRHQTTSMEDDFAFLPSRAGEVPAEHFLALVWRAVYRTYALKAPGAVRDLEAVSVHLGTTLPEPSLHRHLGLGYWLTGNLPLARVECGLADADTLQTELWSPDIASRMVDSVTGVTSFRASELSCQSWEARAAPWPEGRLLHLVADVAHVHAAGTPEGLVATLSEEYADLDDLVTGTSPDHALQLVHAAQAAVWAGRFSTAEKCVAILDRGPRPARSLSALRAWIRALVAQGRGDRDTAAVLLTQASEHSGHELPLYDAHVWADRASLSRDPEEAREFRERALQVYRRLGAAPYVSRLEAAAALPEDPASAYDHGLTPRERDVLALLIKGLSYTQIATQLFVTNSTVRYHLSNVYAKLDVTSRHEATEYVLSQPSVLTR